MDEGRVITSPPTGERIRWLDTPAGEDVLRFEYAVAPGGSWPGARLPHRHPNQTERFRIVSGRPVFHVGGRVRRPAVGDVLVVPPGTAHRFRNAGEDELVCHIEIRPALRTRQLFETLFALAREGRAGFGNIPRHPLVGAVVADHFADEVVVGPPALTRAVLRTGRRLAEVLGLAGRYRDAIVR